MFSAPISDMKNASIFIFSQSCLGARKKVHSKKVLMRINWRTGQVSREIDVCQDDIALSEIYLSVSVFLSLSSLSLSLCLLVFQPSVSGWEISHTFNKVNLSVKAATVENRDEVKKKLWRKSLCQDHWGLSRLLGMDTHTHTQYQGGEEIECTTIR